MTTPNPGAGCRGAAASAELPVSSRATPSHRAATDAAVDERPNANHHHYQRMGAIRARLLWLLASWFMQQHASEGRRSGRRQLVVLSPRHCLMCALAPWITWTPRSLHHELVVSSWPCGVVQCLVIVVPGGTSRAIHLLQPSCDLHHCGDLQLAMPYAQLANLGFALGASDERRLRFKSRYYSFLDTLAQPRQCVARATIREC